MTKVTLLVFFEKIFGRA